METKEEKTYSFKIEIDTATYNFSVVGCSSETEAKATLAKHLADIIENLK